MPKVIAISDLHGDLPTIPACDLLLIGGDICPVRGGHSPTTQLHWLDGSFRRWLRELREDGVDRVVGIAGNHDFVFEKNPAGVAELALPWNYLQDALIEVCGLKIYGTPWVPNLPSWAFYGGPSSRVSWTKLDPIPKDLDILLSHGPMYGYGDDIGDGIYGHVGCRNMADAVKVLKPKAFVCGHIHEGYGHYRHPDIEYGVFNVAHMDAQYEPVNAPQELHDFFYGD